MAAWASGGAEALGVVAGVAIGGQHVVQARGEAMLRRQTVVDRQHRAARGLGQDRAEDVAGFQVADHPAAEVAEDHQRRLAVLGLGAIEARRNGSGGPWDIDRLEADAGLGRAGHDRQRHRAAEPRVLRRQRGHRRRAAGLGGDVLQARIEGAATLIDDPAAGHQAQHRRRQAEQGVEDGALGGCAGHQAGAFGRPFSPPRIMVTANSVAPAVSTGRRSSILSPTSRAMAMQAAAM